MGNLEKLPGYCICDLASGYRAKAKQGGCHGSIAASSFPDIECQRNFQFGDHAKAFAEACMQLRKLDSVRLHEYAKESIMRLGPMIECSILYRVQLDHPQVPAACGPMDPRTLRPANTLSPAGAMRNLIQNSDARDADRRQQDAVFVQHRWQAESISAVPLAVDGAYDAGCGQPRDVDRAAHRRPDHVCL